MRTPQESGRRIPRSLKQEKFIRYLDGELNPEAKNSPKENNGFSTEPQSAGEAYLTGGMDGVLSYLEKNPLRE